MSTEQQIFDELEKARLNTIRVGHNVSALLAELAAKDAEIAALSSANFNLCKRCDLAEARLASADKPWQEQAAEWWNRIHEYSPRLMAVAQTEGCPIRLSGERCPSCTNRANEIYDKILRYHREKPTAPVEQPEPGTRSDICGDDPGHCNHAQRPQPEAERQCKVTPKEDSICDNCKMFLRATQVEGGKCTRDPVWITKNPGSWCASFEQKEKYEHR